MNTLLILRSEIISIFIMTFLIIYDRYCSRFRNEKNTFFKFAVVCLLHCIFAFITEITVNMDTVPKLINDICHILFFLFSLTYSLYYFSYALSLILPKGKIRNRLMIAGNVISLAAVIIMILSPIEYLQGNGTKYSAGMGPTLCYSLGFLFFIVADIIMLINRKQINEAVYICLVPLSMIVLCLLIIQIMIPEFLFTAPALTLLAVGLFFSIENPVGKFKNDAFIDHNVQIWNRNCYEYDVEHIINKKIKEGSELIYVMNDINGLKAVNDNLGHIEGDKLIEKVTYYLQSELKSAFKIYRIGGDEFVAIYFDKDLSLVEEEIGKASKNCSEIKVGKNLPVGISIGYAPGLKNETLSEVMKHAEVMMYENKRRYYSESGINRRTV